MKKKKIKNWQKVSVELLLLNSHYIKDPSQRLDAIKNICHNLLIGTVI